MENGLKWWIFSAWQRPLETVKTISKKGIQNMSLSEVDIFREYALTNSDIELGEPATEQEIADFETRYGIQFPADVREYFLKINGVYESGGFIGIEPLNEWCLASEFEYGYHSELLSEYVDQYFQFGHYDLLVWHWLIKLSPNPEAETPIVVIFKETAKIADNFTDFLQKFRIFDPGNLLR